MNLDVIFSCIIVVPKSPAFHAKFHYPDTGIFDKPDSPHALTIRVSKNTIAWLQFLSLKPTWAVGEAANSYYPQ